MNQSAVQAGALLLAFIIYTTLKGNLAKYFEVIGVR
jgi:hypothetical protein